MTRPALAVVIALAMYAVAKLWAWLDARGWRAPWRRTIAWPLWAGMDARAFLWPRLAASGLEGREAGAALATATLGLALVMLSPTLASDVASGACAVAGCALVLHFGLLRLVDALARSQGVDAPRLMDAPWRAASLGDFWSRRWNTAYAELSARLVLTPLRRASRGARIVAAFLVSGLVHELAISVPAGAGYGGPSAYFALQSAALLAERSRAGRRLGLGHGLRGRVFALACVLLPAPLLLHRPFLERVAAPLASALVPELAMPSLTSVASLALWLAGIAHFCVLVAGVQVPHRLAWRSELACLSRFNRRLMWAYHGFVGLTILGFGVITLVLHDEILRGDRAALAIVALMAAWWIGRILVDVFWYSHEDWPCGRAFVVGHAALVVAFVGMASTYSGILVAHAAGALS